MSNWTPEELAAQRKPHIDAEFHREGDSLVGGEPRSDYERSVTRPLIEAAIRGANARQVAGSHYGLSNLQHWDLVVLYGWDYFQGQIIKYVMRCKKKNGLEDLKKAQHYLEKYIEEIEAGRIVLK